MFSLSLCIYLTFTHFIWYLNNEQRLQYVCDVGRARNSIIILFTGQKKFTIETRTTFEIVSFIFFSLNLNAIEFIFPFENRGMFRESAVSSLQHGDGKSLKRYHGFCVHKLVINLIHITESK